MLRISVFFLVFVSLALSSCGQGAHVNPTGTALKDRIVAPNGYTRVAEKEGSFGAYLRVLPLKPDGYPVHFYNGQIKDKKGVYMAVVDMPIGNKDLQQCADVVMHVRAEYLYRAHKEDLIHFTFTNGFKAPYTKWMEGYRIVVKGNNVEWVKKAVPDNSFAGFTQYMDYVYTYCGSLSLSKELKKVSIKDMQPGDVFIKGGTPGHAEIVLDVAANAAGKKVFLLAQSYMPAQEMQVLQNPRNVSLSPWYEYNDGDAKITTPEWEFFPDQLMRFEDK